MTAVVVLCIGVIESQLPINIDRGCGSIQKGRFLPLELVLCGVMEWILCKVTHPDSLDWDPHLVIPISGNTVWALPALTKQGWPLPFVHIF